MVIFDNILQEKKRQLVLRDFTKAFSAGTSLHQFLWDEATESISTVCPPPPSSSPALPNPEWDTIDHRRVTSSSMSFLLTYGTSE